MGIFDKMKEPEFLKESSDAQRQLENLRALEPHLNPEGKKKLQEDCRLLEYGLFGEQNIAFELKNSHMPMYILHDIYLESGDLTAQIDYLVVTRKLCFVIECKNLYGNIEINNAGDFIRTIEFNGRKRKEGIYSPITQNQRHMELLKKMRAERKSNLLTKMLAGNLFYDIHKSVIVLANPKTVLSAKYAKKETRDQVIRADQLVSFIKSACKASKEAELSDKQLLSWAQSYLELHKEAPRDYLAKYDPYRLDTERQTVKEEVSEQQQDPVPAPSLEDREVYKELKKYRLEKSREEGIKAYYIFNDSQLRDLVERSPRTEEELLAIHGFGPAKMQKYGSAILNILIQFGNETPLQ